MDGRSRVIAWLARCSVRVVPAERREWAQAVWAEAGEVPARARLFWVAGGLWLVAKEAGMVRRIGYWLGVAALAVAAAVVVSLVWRGAPVAPGFRSVSLRAISTGAAGVYVDPRTTGEYRSLAIATVLLLAALPWVARGRGVFGPVSDNAAARIVRVGGCAAICVLVLVLARLAQTLGENLGTRPSSPQEAIRMGVITAYLAAICAVTALRWSPRWATRLGEEERTVIAAVAIFVGFVLFVLDPAWWLIATYAAGFLLVTARGSRIAPATLAFGAGGGVALALLWYLAASTERHFLESNPWLVPVVFVMAFATPAAAGAAAARRIPERDDPEALRRECFRQSVTAGVLTGASASLLITISVLGTMVVDHLQFNPHSTGVYLGVLFLGPLLGTIMGTVSGFVVSERRSPPRLEGRPVQTPAPAPPTI